MKRFFVCLMIVSALLCVAFTALWIRSYWATPVVSWEDGPRERSPWRFCGAYAEAMAG